MLDEMDKANEAFSELEGLINILKDAVENKNDLWYLSSFVNIIMTKTENFAGCFGDYNIAVVKELMVKENF